LSPDIEIEIFVQFLFLLIDVNKQSYFVSHRLTMTQISAILNPVLSLLWQTGERAGAANASGRAGGRKADGRAGPGAGVGPASGREG
jgi:hypothetical protein